MTPIYVSFFTEAYESEAAGLVESLDRFGLPHDIQAVPSLGSWVKNCGHKPTFIREMMLRHEGRPLVWVDADARVKLRPSLFDTLDCDFAAHWRHGIELLSGTIFWNSMPAAWRLVKVWCEEQKRNPNTWDQITLQRVIEANVVEGLKIDRLPATYTAIFDGEMCEEKDQIIRHGQASRRLAKNVK